MLFNNVIKSLKNSSHQINLTEKESDFHHYEMNFHKHSKLAVFVRNEVLITSQKHLCDGGKSGHISEKLMEKLKKKKLLAHMSCLSIVRASV